MKSLPALLSVLIVPVLSCSVWHDQPLPSPVSRTPLPTGQLRAGMARTDITPPPGVGMAGSGPEGRRSTGYRTRLYVGALVLEDVTGERIALVVADLPHITANLHRLAAARLVRTTGIGADRLIISATHTHSGPGHFYGERQYNASTSRIEGYDPRMVGFLVERISDAVSRAVDSRRAATIAWGQVAVPGVITNRSLEAYCENWEVKQSCMHAYGKPDPAQAVDNRLFMLRVDERDGSPIGSYSVFALHGTSIPSLNTLLDGDAHVRIVQRLAAQADSHRPTIHLLANGAEGDVSPVIKRNDCNVPAIGLIDPVPMPRGPGEAVDFIQTSAARARACIDHALVQVDRLADTVAASAVQLFRNLTNGRSHGVEIRRAFTTAWLPGNDGLCGQAELGTATAAGAELLEPRVRGWRWLLWPIARLSFEEGKSAVKKTGPWCHLPKKTLLGPLQATLIAGEHGFPEVAQLSVVRIDNMLLAAVPAEVTTTAARRILEAIDSASSPTTPQSAVLVGLANGFIQYVTTEEEYQLQHYEGGSTLYGPGTAGFLGRRLVELATQLPKPGTGPSPPAEVDAITAYPGAPKAILPSPTAGPAGPIRGDIAVACKDGSFVAEWLDLAPGRLFPRDSTLVVLEREEAGGKWTPVAVDGDGQLEVSALRDRGEKGFTWEAKWRGPSAGAQLRLTRLGDGTANDRVSEPKSCNINRN